MLQQYQQQPDYTPYGTGIGYGAQPSSAAGYFNYAASESSWYGSPSPADAQVHSGLSQNACNNHVGDSTGNFLNHAGYHQTTTTGTASSSAESFATNGHPASQANMDPMADFLGGHQNMNENDKIKEEPIDWLSTIINEEVADCGNRQDGGGGGACDGGGDGGKLVAGGADLPRKSHEPNGRLPNFHQAFGSTEIGRFSQHEYYEPPKDGECLQTSTGGGQGSGAGAAQQRDDQPPAAAFEPPRQQNRRGRTPRGGGQHRRAKQSRTTAAAAAAAAAAAVHQYVNYDVTGSATVGGSGGRHQVPPYHHQDPYGRHQHVQQRYHHQQEYHGHHQQTSTTPSLYQSHQHEQYYRPYERMHYQQQQQQQHQLQHQQQQQQQQHQHQQQQQQQQPAVPMNQYYGGNRGEQSAYAAGGYNRFHSCCSTEHIARPSHHNYGPGQYYGDYNAYSQW